MAIEIIEGQQAYANLSNSNGLSRWPRLDTAEKIYPVAYTACNPKFEIKTTDKVFCIGSCFTREIEQAMSRMGFDVLSIRAQSSQESEQGGCRCRHVQQIHRGLDLQ